MRTTTGFTQERLAEAAGIHPRYLQRVEYGTVSVSLEVFLRLRRALGCQWQELLRGID